MESESEWTVAAGSYALQPRKRHETFGYCRIEGIWEERH